MTAEERFLRLVAFETASDEENPACPSTPGQRVLAEELVRQMKGMGIGDAAVDEFGYVYGTLPARGREDWPTVGLIAHMDTSPEASGKNVRPRVVEVYDGGDVVLNKEKNIVLRTADFPELLDLRGHRMIFTDGTTLLGADDKAGIAEILTAADVLLHSDLPHGTVKICFTPDEEIGRGADRFDVARFGADHAYTVDGGALGELEYENFNAASGRVTVRGVNVHPGSAKDKMKHSLLIAMEFQSMLPPDQIPARTQGYEGFFHLCNLRGDVEKTEMSYIIRDHDRTLFEEKKALFCRIGEELNRKYGPGTVEAVCTDSYYNMKEKILPRMEIIRAAERAMKKEGVAPKVCPIRGGTDGARLSFEGLPCPNLCTGGGAFHARFEYLSVTEMDATVRILVNLLTDPM